MNNLALDTVLTMAQALQLVGLAPCIFLVIFLATLSFRNREALVPAGYFLALACGFALPLMALWPHVEKPWLLAALLLGESMLASFVFLLVMQFVLGRVPAWRYWLVLAVPLLGGGLLVRATLAHGDEPCLQGTLCLEPASLEMLYNIVSSGFVFLLLVYFSSRAGEMTTDRQRGHKYWLVVALILLNLFVLAIDLAHVAGRLSQEEAQFATTMFRLTFIYLAITSIFRVFYPGMAREVIELSTPPRPAYNPELDAKHIEKILELLEKDRVFCEMRLNRAGLAERVGVSEHQLSRIINAHFGKNFNELVNSYRVEEAKRRLKNEPETQITIIGFEAGFNSIASFNRVFKEKVGVSPTEFRSKGQTA